MFEAKTRREEARSAGAPTEKSLSTPRGQARLP